MSAIVLTGLSKHFGAKRAVNDVSFEVAEGACYGLIGPNGAGKTTTFSMMCGYLFPTAGTVTVLGHNPTEPGVLKGKVGVLPQDEILPPTWPVGSLLTYYGRLSQLPNAEKEARAVLERVALPETWSVPAGSLSHGMAKRVSMAQALMGAPPVVFLDAPPAGLDPQIAASVRVQIARGEVPLSEVRLLDGCRNCQLEQNGKVLAVNYDGTKVVPEVIITACVGLLAQRGVLILGVTRGKRLEERVLQLT